jgi:hypothetical protein
MPQKLQISINVGFLNWDKLTNQAEFGNVIDIKKPLYLLTTVLGN